MVNLPYHFYRHCHQLIVHVEGQQHARTFDLVMIGWSFKLQHSAPKKMFAEKVILRFPYVTNFAMEFVKEWYKTNYFIFLFRLKSIHLVTDELHAITRLPKIIRYPENSFDNVQFCLFQLLHKHMYCMTLICVVQVKDLIYIKCTKFVITTFLVRTLLYFVIQASSHFFFLCLSCNSGPLSRYKTCQQKWRI